MRNRLARRLIGTLLALSALCFTRVGARAEKTLTLTFAGDCTIGCEDDLRNRDYALPAFVERYGDAYFFQNVKALFDEDDFTVVNFEGVLRDNEYSKVNKTYNFRGPSTYASILTAGGVEVAGLENNHVGDYGESGLNSTIAALEAYGVRTFSRIQPVVLESKDGLRVAMVGMQRSKYYTHGPALRETIARLKAEGALVHRCGRGPRGRRAPACDSGRGGLPRPLHRLQPRQFRLWRQREDSRAGNPRGTAYDTL